jgi:aminoglycoside 6'-N-acetyltransferase
MDLTLEPFQPSHLALLESWLRQPHVVRWYPEPARDMSLATTPPAAGSHALIALDGVAVGYVRWQHVDRETLDELGLHAIPENSVDIDILIGSEADTARGVGPMALEQLAATFLQDATVPVLGLTTSVDNLRAQRAFAKAGFRILLQYDPSGHGLCHLMIRDLRSERSA